MLSAEREPPVPCFGLFHGSHPGTASSSWTLRDRVSGGPPRGANLPYQLLHQLLPGSQTFKGCGLSLLHKPASGLPTACCEPSAPPWKSASGPQTAVCFCLHLSSPTALSFLTFTPKAHSSFGFQLTFQAALQSVLLFLVLPSSELLHPFLPALQGCPCWPCLLPSVISSE